MIKAAFHCRNCSYGTIDDNAGHFFQFGRWCIHCNSVAEIAFLYDDKIGVVEGKINTPVYQYVLKDNGMYRLERKNGKHF